MMKRLSLLAFAAAFLAAGCGSSSSTAPTTPTNPTFTATLLPANEVPPIVGAEASGSGTATVTIVTTKDGNGNVTAATATFVVNLQGFPPNTPINIAHIHGPAGAGSVGNVVVNSQLTAGTVVLNSSGAGTFTAANLSISPVDVANQILNNPGNFYFNVHSTLNPGGVARGQLVKAQ